MKWHKPKYYPWVGKNFFEAEKRILIVGVKFYSVDPSSVLPDSAIDIVERSIRNSMVEGYFDTFDRTIGLLKQDGETSEDVWQRIAFYNYTQEVLPDANSFPTYEQIDKSKDAYVEVLCKLRPHKVLFWGVNIYNSVLCGIGKEAQRINGHETWMIDMHLLDEDVPEGEHAIHVSYVNDPSHVDFDFDLWRESVGEYISCVPSERTDTQIKRRVVQLLRFMNISYDGYVAFNGSDLPDVLSKAIARGIIHFEPEQGIVDAQRLKGESTTATAYFACMLRKAMHKKSDSRRAAQSLTYTLEMLLDKEKYAISKSEDGLSITFSSLKQNRKRDVAQIYERLVALSKQDADNEPLQWKELEALFDTKNMRQYAKDVSKTKVYAKRIDEFFGRIEG